MDYINFFLIGMKVTAKIPWPQLYLEPYFCVIFHFYKLD
jgi:hypothetical protein